MLVSEVQYFLGPSSYTILPDKGIMTEQSGKQET
jgi:hypothetical protein